MLVAPRAGAWIETTIFKGWCHVAIVAPRAGAWIETIAARVGGRYVESHPVRVRGLKLVT